MDKKFFIIVSYTPPTLGQGGGSKNPLAALMGSSKSNDQINDQLFEEAKSQLEQRVDLVKSGISRTGLRLVDLDTEAAVEVLYRIFNPGESEKPVQVT